MYKEHSSFITPDDVTKIWRYMNVDKFLDFITSSCLYFSPSHQLGDALEGSFTVGDVCYLRSLHPEMQGRLSLHAQNSLPSYKINCWHIAEKESLSMWNSYTERGKGIVIQSTIGRLKRSLEKVADDIFVGKVEYIDHYTCEVPSLGNDFNRFLKKDSSFSYEEEVRAIKLVVKSKDGVWDYSAQCPREDQIVSIDLLALVENVIVSPGMSKWLEEALQKVLRRFYSDIEVKSSELKKVPIFA